MHNKRNEIIEGTVYYRRHGGVCAMTNDGVCYYLLDDVANQDVGLQSGEKVIMEIKDDELVAYVKNEENERS